eukprot:m.159062 g.159062  ORF g.159062 m.159062 type:complete len:172 (+) comp17034_c0_seq3:107-622(+)
MSKAAPPLRPRSFISLKPNLRSFVQPVTTHEAIHFFAARYEDELSFFPGERVEVLQTPLGGWWEGRIKGKRGWFPRTYVRATDLNGEQTPLTCALARGDVLGLSDKFGWKIFIAESAHQAEDEDEIEFVRGDHINVMQAPEGDYWEGMCHGRTGWFPCECASSEPVSESRL